MNNNPNTKYENIQIRLERKEDYEQVENLVRESFWNVYRPGCLEHYLLNQLRNSPDFVKELDFIMEKEGELIGQIVFVKAKITSDNGHIPIMTLGPMSIAPKFKRQGYGKILLDYSLEKAKKLGCGAICIEGNIDFYKNSGFTYAKNFGIKYHGLDENADTSFFLCNELIPGYLKEATGEYSTPKDYFVNEKEAEEFDKKFEYKEKLKLPNQIF